MLAWLLVGVVDGRGRVVRADEPAPRAWTAVLGVSRARATLLGEGVADEPARIAAATLLAQVPEGASPEPTLRAALAREQAPRVREALLVALARCARPESVVALALIAERGDPVERGLAARALAGLGNDAALRALVRGLAGPDASTVFAPMLVRVGPVVVPKLLRALADPPAAVAAAQALGALGDARATAPLVALLDSPREADRIAGLEALAALGDARAADAVAARVGDAAPEVVLAALGALAVLGDASHVAVLEARLRSGRAEERRAALAALVAADPRAGAAAISAVLTDADPALLGAARVLLLAATHPRFAPLLEARVAVDAQPESVAAALGALAGGAGVPTLTRLALRARPGLQRTVAGALAVALRTWGADLDAAVAAEGREALALACATLPAPEAALLRALARDAAVAPLLRAALRDAAPAAAAARAAAAEGAEALGDPTLGADVLAALAREDDAEAWRRLADAARSLRVASPVAPLLARTHDPETGPEALELAAASLDGASPEDRRRFAVLARAALRAPDERLRAAAARALALAADVGASRALLAATRDDSEVVAVAAARALAALPARPTFAAALAAEARSCAADRVRAALLDAHAAAANGRPAPLTLRGEHVLHVRLALGGAPRAEGVGLDLRLPDGRLQRRRALPGGALFVPDLAAGVADVTLHAGDAVAP